MAIVAQCTPRTFTGDRDRALLLMLLDTGIRQAGLTGLTLSDVDTATGAELIRQGKGRKPRTLFVGAKTKRALLAYLRHRKKLDADEGLWVHVDTGQKIRRHAAQADVPMHPHRHRKQPHSQVRQPRLREGMNFFAL